MPPGFNQPGEHPTFATFFKELVATFVVHLNSSSDGLIGTDENANRQFSLSHNLSYVVWESTDLLLTVSRKPDLR